MITSFDTTSSIGNSISLPKHSAYGNKENNEKPKNYTEGSFVTFSDDANNIIEAEKIENQLGDIFGTNKPLSPEQKKEVDDINKELDSILGIKPLSQEQKIASKKIMESIDDIFKDAHVTADEEKQLKILDAKMNEIHGINKEKKLTQADEKRLDALFTKLDSILGLPMLPKGDLIKIDPNDENTIINFPPFKMLTDSEQKQADDINKEIDEIYGIKQLSKQDMALSDKLHKEIEALFEDGKLTNEEETKLQSLGKRLDDLYGMPKVLSDAEHKKIQELFQSLDKLHGFNDVSKGMLIEAEDLYTNLDNINS